MKTKNKVSVKELTEQRNELLQKAESLVSGAQAENRMIDNEEFHKISNEIRSIDIQLLSEPAEMRSSKGIKKELTQEERAFVEFVKNGKAEERAGLDVGSNAGIIPTSVANRVWNKIQQISPIVALATHYNVKEQLQLPIHDYTTSYTVAFTSEFSALVPNATAFTSVTLKNQIIGVLVKVGRSLMNMTSPAIDLLSIVVDELAMALANFIEKEILQNLNGRFTETLKAVNRSMTTATTLQIGVSEVVQLMNLVPAQAMANGSFIMHQSVYSYLMQQKDSQGRLLFNTDTGTVDGFGAVPTLMGKPVYFSDNADLIASGKAQMYFGDFSSLVIKDGQTMSIEVARELYLPEYAVGVAAFCEIDVALPNKQQIAVMIGK